jgi:hypothetical protein
MRANQSLGRSAGVREDVVHRRSPTARHLVCHVAWVLSGFRTILKVVLGSGNERSVREQERGIVKPAILRLTGAANRHHEICFPPPSMPRCICSKLGPSQNSVENSLNIHLLAEEHHCAVELRRLACERDDCL